ncbi:MAG: hypothetical protein NT165_01045 [Candidatus Falkowbacteria bacterium]|nr:hypothetical protein [Candidatus Falkowbacteria bacterium]
MGKQLVRFVLVQDGDTQTNVPVDFFAKPGKKIPVAHSYLKPGVDIEYIGNKNSKCKTVQAHAQRADKILGKGKRLKFLKFSDEGKEPIYRPV